VFGHSVFGHLVYGHSTLGLSVLGHSAFGHSAFRLSAFSGWIVQTRLDAIAQTCWYMYTDTIVRKFLPNKQVGIYLFISEKSTKLMSKFPLKYSSTVYNIKGKSNKKFQKISLTKLVVAIVLLWRPCSFIPIHSHTGLVGQPFAPHLGNNGLRPWGKPTLTMEPGSPASDVSLHWWPRCDPWSPATIAPLSRDLATTLATSAASAMPSSIPFFSLQVLLLLAMHWPVQSPRSSCWGGGGGGKPSECPATSLQYMQSHWCSGSTICSPPWGDSGSCPLR
jgi:hypothetical protein